MKLCSPHCGLEPGSNSGGAVYDRELLTALAKTVEVHLPTGRPVPAALAKGVEKIWPRVGWRWWYSAPLVARAVAKCGREHRPDIVRAHSARYVGPGCLLARTGAPLVVHHHHFDGIWQERVDLAVLRRADLVTTDSEFGADCLRAMGITKVVIIPAGVGREFLSAEPTRRGGRVLFLGALKDRKNPLSLPPIMRAVLDAGCLTAEMTVVGDGPRRHEVEQLARLLRVERAMSFAGKIHDEGRPRYYAAADVFVFPSYLEGFGMPVLEAMATGLPVVCSAVGSLPELVRDNWNGFLVKDPDDHAGFAARIVELLRHKNLREEMGRRARIAATRCSWVRSAEILKTALEEMV